MPIGLDTIIGGGVGLAEAAVSLINKGSADREAKRLAATRPKETASPFLRDQLELSESELGTGLGADATKSYTEGLDTDLATSTNAVLMGGGSVNSISRIFGQNQTGRQRLAMMKENVRQNNLTNYMRASTASDEEQQRLFQYNVDAPWKDEAQANAQARQNASKQIWEGVDTAASTVMKGVETDRSEKQLNDYFKISSAYDKPADYYGSDPLIPPTSAVPLNVQQQRLQY